MILYGGIMSIDGTERGRNIDKLLDPDSVAIFGVSLSGDEKMGNIIYDNLKSSDRDVFAINPKAQGEDNFYTNIHDVPKDVDLAVLAIPSKFAVDAVRDCVEFGVGAIILVSGGFGETGKEGEDREEEIKDILKNSETRLLGPNTMGVLLPPVDLDTFFLPEDRVERPGEGGIAFISQSGFMATPFMETLCEHKTGLSAFVGIGNRLDIDEVELLEYFCNDEKTEVIALYLESMSDGRELYEIAKRKASDTPIVMLKGGRSQVGQKATQSHTGSLASTSDRVVKGASKQAGIINAYDERELTDFSEALMLNRPIKDENIAVISSAGGTGVIASDYLEDTDPGFGLNLPSFSPETKERLDEVILPIASSDNPIDLTANVTDDMVDDVLRILQDEEKIDGILLYALFQSPYVGEEMVESISKWYHQGDKPIVVSCIGDRTSPKWREKFYKEGVPAYPSTIRAAKVLDKLVKRGRSLEYLGGSEDE